MTYNVRTRLGLPEKGRGVGFATERNVVKRQPKKEGHDALIQTLSQKITDCTINFGDNTTVTGRLMQSDRFTITLQDLRSGKHIIYYKSFIKSISFEVLEDGGEGNR